MADKVDRDARDPKFKSKRTANGKLMGRPRYNAALPCDASADVEISTIDVIRLELAKRPGGLTAWAVHIAEEQAEMRRVAENSKFETIDIVRACSAKQPTGRKKSTLVQEKDAKQQIISGRQLQIPEKDMKRGWNTVAQKKAAISKLSSKSPKD